tara:strand:+ start:3056 stop:3361 length:306 start_codon:yes stop_codon:yes gene_type:complete
MAKERLNFNTANEGGGLSDAALRAVLDIAGYSLARWFAGDGKRFSGPDYYKQGAGNIILCRAVSNVTGVTDLALVARFKTSEEAIRFLPLIVNNLDLSRYK